MRKDKIKKFLMNPWTIGISTTILGVIVTGIVDAIKQQTIFTTMKIIFVKIWDMIIKFLNLEIKMWVILILIIALILVVFIISRILTYREDNKMPEFIRYTKDELLGYVWEWTWEKNYNGRYEIKNLTPICSKCETPLIPESNFRPLLKCLRCNEYIEWDARKLEQVKVLITDNANKGQYKI